MIRLGKLIQLFRIFKYKLLSTNQRVVGSVVRNQPVQINGRGEVIFEKDVQIGVQNSLGFFSTYGYIEARKKKAKIVLGTHVHINNNLCIVANESSIRIGNHTTIGANCQIYDCNFHSLNPNKRRVEDGSSAPVVIGKNVFIGNNVIILKGVTIGDNCIISAGSVVNRRVEENENFIER